MKIAVSGASGKTGFRVAEEALKNGYQVNLLVREESEIPKSLEKCDCFRLSLNDSESLENALKDCQALFIATGARPSIDLFGPLKVDAFAVKNQVELCKKIGLRRVILVSSLCAGKLFHPLNLFGLILIWKRFGEDFLEKSGLDWSIIRPGGLNEREDDIKEEAIFYTSRNTQEEGSIPRRLVAKCCLESLKTPSSIGEIIEITSNTKVKNISLKQAIQTFQ